jgi:hypothetical protein
MKWYREVILCFLVAIITITLFALTGQFYFANEHSLLTNTFVWLVLCFIAYMSVIFIPFFQKKQVRYIDLFAFASGLLAIMLYCLSQAKSIDEYTYLSVLSYIAGILSIFEMFFCNQRKIERVLLQNKTPPQFLNMISDLPIDIQQDIINLARTHTKGQHFKLIDATNTLNKSEYRTRKVLKIAIERSIIIEEGNTAAKKYQIILD